MSVLDDYNKAKAKRKADQITNSFLDEYEAAKAQRKAKQAKKKKEYEFVGPLAPYYMTGELAPITQGYTSPYMMANQDKLNQSVAERLASKQTERESKERTWFEPGSDNIAKTILGTATDALEDFEKGVYGTAERVLDFGASLYPYASAAVRRIGNEQTYNELLAEEKKKADAFAAKDTINESEIAKTMLSVLPTATKMLTTPGAITNPVEWILAARNQQKISDYIENDMEADSVLGEKSEALVQSAGQLAAQYGLTTVNVPWFVTSSVTSFGGEFENALQQGATHEQAMGSAAITAGAEILSEKLFGGDLFTKKAGADLAAKWLATNISNKAWRTALKFGMDVAGEGVEEAFSEFVGNLGSKLYREENLGELLFNEEALDGYLEAAIGGWVLGGGMSGVNAVQSAVKGKDYTTGLTANEQAVVDKVYNDLLAEQEGEVSAREKSKLYDQVLEMMDRGEISTDVIESVLAKDSYDAYDALQKESEEFSTLYDTESGKLSGKQQDRLNELKAKNEAKPYESELLTARQNLSDSVYGMVRGDRLAQSYNERGKRGQAFTADLAQYDPKQRDTIQKAIDSGILNDTRRTHEFVDFIAKISADKGVLFDFANNEKLKGSSFAIDGKTVNGFVTKDGITLNVNSSKALNTVVGHEITHVLEGTEFYDTLQEALFDYAVEKGEYYDRLKNLRSVYEGVYSGEDFESQVKKELAADLVGDYLFTDAEFVRRLSTQHRNVFQKIYDEVKYLYRMATAGSKEARELERVKKAFEEAYRAGGGYLTGNDTKSLSEPVTDAQNERGLDTKSEVQFSLSKDTEYMDAAISANESMHRVDGNVLASAKTLRERIAARMTDIMERGLAGLPEDIEGNTYIANSSYDGTEENTTICPRSLAAEAFVDAVSEYLGRPLTVEEQIYISQDLQGRSLTPECTYCYVATDRKAYRAFLGEYVAQRDAVLKKLQENPGADVSRSGELYREFLNGRKDTNPMYSRFKMWVDAYTNGKPLIDASHLANMSKLMGDIGSEFGAELKPQIVDAMKYAQSASWAKKRVNYVAYNGHILKWKQSRIDKLNGHYGLRMYSFSDFHPAFVLENMQMITDASVKGLKMLGYTKDTDFVEIFAPSGMNINVSTFGFESGGNVYENNLIGAEWEKAKALREQHPNVGITFVATNDTLVDWALAQDWIDVVIPFHLVRTGKEVAKAFKYHDYTGESSDVKTKDWQKGDKKYIAPTEHNNDKATYLAALEANHLKPRFERFIGNPNYMKLVNECRRPASESKPVQPVFNEDAAMVALAKLEANGYYQPVGGSVDRMYEIAGEVAEAMTGQLAPALSLSRTGETFAPRGDYNVYGEDVALAPVQESVAKNATVEEDLPDDLAPMGDDPERFTSLTDADAPPVDDFAPVMQKPVQIASEEQIAPIVRAKPERAVPKPVETAKATADPNVAKILTEEQPRDKKKSGPWSWAKEHILDNGMVFEDLSIATGNRELQARWNSIRYAEGKAQKLIGEGNASVSSLKSIRDAVEETGKAQQFYEYLYHLHNVDRMSLEERASFRRRMLHEKFSRLRNDQIRAIAAKEITEKTTARTAATIQEAKEYLNAGEVKNKPVFGDSVTADDSRKAAAALEKANPEFKQFAKEVYDFNTYLRELLVDGGVISRETAKLWEEMYPHYVPIRRAGDTGLNINVPLDTGRTGVNAPIKRATGGSRDILPLFDTMAQRAIQTYKAIAKNRFGVELKNTLGTTIANEATDIDEVIDSVDTQDGLLQEGKNGQKPTFTVFEDGKKVTFEITEEMYDAMKPSNFTWTSKTLNAISNIRRGTLTEYNPWFLLKNAVKDVQDVLINSQHPGRTYLSIPKAISQMATNGRYYQEYLDNGGEQNTYFDNQTTSFAKENKALETVKKVFGLDAISKANNVIERLPRLAEYIASREAGRSVDVAMLDAARVTTNFAAGGDLTKLLNRNGATFLNASVQGAMQQARNIREAKMNGLKGWAGLAARYLVAGLPALALNHLLWDDDEEYAELSDYIKQNYYIVGKYGNGHFVRIPKGRTVAVIQNAFEQMKNLITGNDEADLKSFLDLVVSNLAPNSPLDNNILSPIAQVRKNETWYGEDLVPTRLQNLPTEEQYDETTDAISKWLGENFDPFDLGPVKINYLIDQYSGFLGDTFLPMLTPAAESGDNSLLGNLIAPLKDMFTTDSVMKNQNVSDFYTKVDELTVNANASGATDEDILMSKYMSSVNSELGDLYKQKREIQNSDLPDDEKYAQVREIQQQIVDMAREGLDTFENVSIMDDYAKVGDVYFHRNKEGEWQKLTDEQTTKYLVTSTAGNSDYASDGTNFYHRDDDGEWKKMSDEQIAKYLATAEAGDGHYATDGGDNHYRLYEKEGEEPTWKRLTDEQIEKQEEVTKGLGITPEEYWSNKEEYDFAYENPEKYVVAKSVGGYESYRTYSSELYDIKADKDANGDSIRGSRKDKVIDYVSGLDCDYGMKLILFKNEYNADDTYNYEIIDYLNSRDDISYEDTVTILKELGFDVDSEGNISW